MRLGYSAGVLRYFWPFCLLGLVVPEQFAPWLVHWQLLRLGGPSLGVDKVWYLQLRLHWPPLSLVKGLQRRA